MNPFPGEASVAVMDNCQVHNKAELEQVADVMRSVVLFLPPYSPMFNLIESMFGTYKQWLKSNRDVVSQHPADVAINMAFASITAAQCEAWIRSVPAYDS